MTQENVEILYRFATAAGARDLATFVELTHPSVEWRTSLSVISAEGTYHGHEGLRQYVSDIDEAFEVFEVSLDDVLGVGDLVFGVGHITYCGKASGVRQTEQFGWLARFREGQVTYLRAFRNPEQALAKVGLSE